MAELLAEEPRELVELILNIERVAESLPKKELQAYEEAQASIVEARRNAETHEGFLQLR
jgi:hypothetical protein